MKLIYKLMKTTEYNKLMYDLIFTNDEEFYIDISMYIHDIYEYAKFIENTERALKKSKVLVVKSEVITSSVTVFWKLKVRR